MARFLQERGGSVSWDPNEYRQHGALDSSTGYAVALTHTHALVWPYTSTTASPETFTFTLPYPSKHASDPLPLASLVSPPASSEEPGLVVVMPVSGKIAYWESISSAATLDFIRQQRSGVEDAVHGMFSGEHVVQLLNAESAGFVLVFSSGRLAYLSVRDGHGRPAIFVQFLRVGLGHATGGFFGSIRHALSASSLRNDIAAVHASRDVKVGERLVVAATGKGKLHAWRIHRGGHHDVLAEVDIRDSVARALQEGHAAAGQRPHASSLEIVDFTFVPRDVDPRYRDANRLSAAMSSREDTLQHLLVLVYAGGRYALVEVVLTGGAAQVGVVLPVTSYTTPLPAASADRPRLYLPRPALVAFLVFDRSVVLASLASPPESPESQLQEDLHATPLTYEDVIDLRDDNTVEVVGSGIEEPVGTALPAEELTRNNSHRHRTKNPAALLLVRGVGVVRVALTDVDRFASDRPPVVTAKSKLEQAVFFGIRADNPLRFEGRRPLPFASEDVRAAAIQLSFDIVSSRTPHVTNLPASLESNLRTRIEHLEKLIAHLNALDVHLDPATRRSLLWDAEKMAVALWIWRQHEAFLAERPKGSKRTIVSETAAYIREEQKSETVPAVVESDPVRHWFLNDVFRIDIFVAWGYQVIKHHYQDRLSDHASLNRLLYEAVTVSTGALREAHLFRAEHVASYRLQKQSSKEDTAVPWDATHFITNNYKRLVEFCHKWLDQYYGDAAAPSLDADLLESIRQQLPALTREYLAALVAYAEWAT
ncbi:hypothetical protein VTK73DRAFT_2906 [Phialemonium thermophilum]|uniref:Nucleoporin Nup133/Nup155-like N-terminal domain-containing protein n=1 Tax=Phialemonium thermophilum TaxID=223376 RepID=A0ABR3VNM6_9PEZI